MLNNLSTQKKKKKVSWDQTAERTRCQVSDLSVNLLVAILLNMIFTSSYDVVQNEICVVRLQNFFNFGYNTKRQPHGGGWNFFFFYYMERWINQQFTQQEYVCSYFHIYILWAEFFVSNNNFFLLLLFFVSCCLSHKFAMQRYLFRVFF